MKALPGVHRLVALAEDMRARHGHTALCVNHWFAALVERHGAMAEALGQGVNAGVLHNALRSYLGSGRHGPAFTRESMLGDANARANARGRDTVAESDLCCAILAAAGYTLSPAATGGYRAPAPAAPAPTSAAQTPSRNAILPPPRSAPEESAPRAERPAPRPYAPDNAQQRESLDRYGVDLTDEAHSGKLGPVIGREDETALLIETLCRSTKRNPVLVGPAGAGKTAIVEGLARRIAEGNVPEQLKHTRLYALQVSSLVAGASLIGDIEKRMSAILTEARQPGILLFIDEVHSIMGAGGKTGAGDVATILKPALARGDIALIAATTDDEYRKFIEQDSALERRFQPVRVQELTPGQTLQVLESLAAHLEKKRSVKVAPELLPWLVDFAEQFLRNRHFPDKAVDLLDQCVAYAIAAGKARVSQPDGEVVAQRMVGMPLSASSRLADLRKTLHDRALVDEETADALVYRLRVTVPGLDARPERPNAIVLLCGAASAHAEPLADGVAEKLFGARERQVVIDFSRFAHHTDVSMLTGSGRGYVGYGESLAIHRITQMPWCVLRCERVDACHPQAREVLTQALASGFFTDSSGKRIYLSDTVVLLTTSIESTEARAVGFGKADDQRAQGHRKALVAALGQGLVDQCDLVVSRLWHDDQQRKRWIEANVLADLASRCRKQSIELSFGPGLFAWLHTTLGPDASRRDLERLVEEHVGAALLPHIEPPRRPGRVVVDHDGKLVTATRDDQGAP